MPSLSALFRLLFLAWFILLSQSVVAAPDMPVMSEQKTPQQKSPQFFSEELAKLRKQAAAGVTKAQSSLGLMYFNGWGVTQDFQQAFIWAQKAAEQGDAKAQSNLGLMYFNGWGVVQDFKQAFIWTQKAAEQGYTKAQYNLGAMYREG